MKEIFLVESGCYSSRKILGAYSKVGDAEKVVAQLKGIYDHDDFRQFKISLDEDLNLDVNLKMKEQGFSLWEVYFDKNGEVDWTHEIEEWEETYEEKDVYRSGKSILCVVWAKSEEEATKIGYDKMTFFKVQEGMK